jgi:hypothetical protein
MRGTMIAQTCSVSLNSSSDELCKIYSFPDGTRQLCYTPFFGSTFVFRLETPQFLPRGAPSIAIFSLE